MEPVQDVALKLGHIQVMDLFPILQAFEGAEDIAHGVAQLAVGFDIGLEDFLAQPQVFRIVGGGHPEAQDIGAGLLDHVLRGHDVAEGLGHLAAVFAHDEAVGENRIIGRAATGAAGFEQRRMKPAAVLVGAFEIDVGGPFQVGALFQAEGVGAARVEPHVENVSDLFPFLGIVVQSRGSGWPRHRQTRRRRPL